MKRSQKRKSRKSARGSRSGRGARPRGPEVHDAAGIDGMRAAGRLAAELLDRVGEMIGPGVSTAQVDQLVAELTEKNGAVSAPYGYGSPPFPGHCCTSVNDVVCHGIPDAGRVLQSGDIVNVDVTPCLDGYHGDSSRTYLIGDVTPVAHRLVADTYLAMWLGIRAVRPGGRVGDVGHAIQTFIEAQGHSVVREFTGHGIGRVFHTPPAVLHFGRPGEGEVLLPGTTFTIEPMVNLGRWKTEILEDGWTAVTTDGMLSAQWEHTCLLTEAGVEVLTLGASETPPPQAPALRA